MRSYLGSRSTTTARIPCSGDDRRQRSIPAGSLVDSPPPRVVRHAARSHAARLRLHHRFHFEHRELHRHVVRLPCLLRSDQHSVHRSDRSSGRERSGDVPFPSPQAGDALDADSVQHRADPSSRRHVRGGPRGPDVARLWKPTRGVTLGTMADGWASRCSHRRQRVRRKRWDARQSLATSSLGGRPYRS